MPTLPSATDNSNAAKGTYQGTYFAINMHIDQFNTKKVKVIYEEAKLDLLLFEIGRVLLEKRCLLVGVDTQEVLRHITGFASNRPIMLKGPKFLPRDEYPPDYDYVANWMLEDRKMIDDLVKIVFSRNDLVARNSKSIVLTPHLDGAATASNAYMKAVIFYAPSPVIGTDIGNDFIRVQIDGDGNGRKTFQFDHTKEWMMNRYLVAPPRSPAMAAAGNAVSASATSPSSDDVD
jgi:hypothetical protein